MGAGDGRDAVRWPEAGNVTTDAVQAQEGPADAQPFTLAQQTAAQEALMASKLGIHIQHIMDEDLMLDWIARVQPGVVKVMDDHPTFLHDGPSVSPETFWIGRAFTEDQDLSNPEEAAREQHDRIMTRADARLPDAWEGFNETAVDDEMRWRQVGRFDGEFARLMHAEGLKTVGGNHGVGHPTDLHFVTLPEVVAGWAEADYIGAHEYCAPTMWDERSFDPPYGHPEEYITGGWWTLRYRQWYKLLPPEAQKPLIITECGIDSGAPHWDPGAQGGWKSFITIKGYMLQLAWYDRQLQMDDYVLGATPFLFGSRDPTWASFDLWEPPEAREAFAAYIVSQQNGNGGNGGDGDWEEQMRALLLENLWTANELLRLFDAYPNPPAIDEAMALIEHGQASITEGVAMLK